MLSGVSVGVASVNASHGTVAWSYSPVNTEHNYTTLVYDVTVVSPWQPVSNRSVSCQVPMVFWWTYAIKQFSLKLFHLNQPWPIKKSLELDYYCAVTTC